MIMENTPGWDIRRRIKDNPKAGKLTGLNLGKGVSNHFHYVKRTTTKVEGVARQGQIGLGTDSWKECIIYLGFIWYKDQIKDRKSVNFCHRPSNTNKSRSKLYNSIWLQCDCLGHIKRGLIFYVVNICGCSLVFWRVDPSRTLYTLVSICWLTKTSKLIWGHNGKDIQEHPRVNNSNSLNTRI